MKFKQVADDDPSAEFEIRENKFEGVYMWTELHRVPKEKTNAEIAIPIGRDRQLKATIHGEDYSVSLTCIVRDILDTVDEKIRKAMEGK